MWAKCLGTACKYCAVVFACVGGSVTAAEIAQTVFTNGHIYTGDQNAAWATTMVVHKKKIVYVGLEDPPTDLLSAKTTYVDLQDRTVMSGIHDAHTHLLLAGWLQNFSCKLTGELTIGRLVDQLKACQKRNASEEDWIIGGLIYANQFPDGKPHRSFLDAHFPNTPIYLHEGSLHHALVNTKALEIAGVDNDTADPHAGKFLRDASGNLTGELVEMATMFVTGHMPKPTPLEVSAAIEWAVRKCAEFGITSVQDATGDVAMLEVLRDMDLSGELKLEVAAHLMWEAPKFSGTAFGSSEDLIKARKEFRTPHVDPNNIKMWLDGSPTPPYFTQSDFNPEKYSPDWEHMLFGQAELNEYVANFDRMGMRVKMHVAGAGAANAALNAVQHARYANEASFLKHELAHTNLVTPDDFSRISFLDMVAEMSPAVWQIYGQTLGDPPQRAWEFKKMLENDVLMTVGTDWAVTDEPNLFPGLAGMLTHGDNSIDIFAATQALTLNGAIAMGREDELGSLMAGKNANFIVLYRNIFEATPREIANTKVLQTFFEGELIFESNEA